MVLFNLLPKGKKSFLACLMGNNILRSKGALWVRDLIWLKPIDNPFELEKLY